MQDDIKSILSKESYNVYDLAEIVRILRSENGCPWDKVQTHQSIRKDFLEEVYEVIDAIDCGDPQMLREELGDVLLQVVFHTEIEKEKEIFDFDDVANDVCRKLIIRHPHVFGNTDADNVDTVLKNWDAIKKETKGQETYADTLKSVPRVFPALMRAQKLGKRAKRAGMDFACAEDALKSLEDEIRELREAVESGRKDDISEELGDVLFSCCNTARHLELDAEEVLTAASDKFLSRFEQTENLIRQDGQDMSALSIDELDVYWRKAKKCMKH
ncbi:nucleoside triphosphate pyrophosphohydrolase [Ruminococcus sp. Marseille-P6503]|uniref:nucleoside triphosphate pyrophosphohydrolase n=1 Tax=Ruminococcus sp. Marseille-P6503 TaxID=2364796 RepID=UPI000F52EE11|nr:nucleoside triphosphate pyrophosphohydrolase [Ruminococcus sp. Marseille-P6503]